MPLTYTGDSMQTMTGTSYKAMGSQNELIIVDISHEAIQDYGEDTCQAKGWIADPAAWRSTCLSGSHPTGD